MLTLFISLEKTTKIINNMLIWFFILEFVLGLLLMAMGTYGAIAIAEAKINHKFLGFWGIVCILLSIVIIILMFHIEYAYIYPMLLKIR